MMTRVEYHQATPRRSCAWREHRVERKRKSTVNISLNKNVKRIARVSFDSFANCLKNPILKHFV